MKQLHVTLSTVFLLLASSPAYASYTDGFFGLIVLFYGFPVMAVGLLVTLVLCATPLFKAGKFYNGYIVFWVSASAIAALITSSMSMQGSDDFSPLLIVIGLAIYAAIVLLPAFLQRRWAKSQADKEATTVE
ncbi:MAG: hypothetical protein OQL16_08350 [Gammaproteobacteria bacterium]|nr:hypothetical protein [Gammaproteobacteria bacterium]